MKDPNRNVGFLSALFVVLSLGMYVGAYFTIVRAGSRTASFGNASYNVTGQVWFAASSNQPASMWIVGAPDYRGLPPALFAPIHYLDRHFFRPNLWISQLIFTNLSPPSAMATRFKSLAPPAVPNGVEAAERINAQQMDEYRFRQEQAIQNPHQIP